MAVNKYGNNKPVVKEKKVKVTILLEVGTEADINEKEGKRFIKTIEKYGKKYNLYQIKESV